MLTGTFFLNVFFLLKVTTGLSRERSAVVETFHSVQTDLNNSSNAPWVTSVQQHITGKSPDGRHGGFYYSNSSLKAPCKRCDELRGMRPRQAASEVCGIDLYLASCQHHLGNAVTSALQTGCFIMRDCVCVCVLYSGEIPPSAFWAPWICFALSQHFL